MKFKKSESGRSMVEMLGVLDIIGVLSVGGIAGYSLSMRRHRANGVADAVSKYALVAYSQCQKKILDGEFDSTTDCNWNYYSKNGSTFENAGIGSLPAGVDYIGAMEIFHDTASGVDTIHMSTRYDDDKLCQAVASITGSICNGGTVQINIKQN